MYNAIHPPTDEPERCQWCSSTDPAHDEAACRDRLGYAEMMAEFNRQYDRDHYEMKCIELAIIYLTHQT